MTEISRLARDMASNFLKVVPQKQSVGLSRAPAEALVVLLVGGHFGHFEHDNAKLWLDDGVLAVPGLHFEDHPLGDVLVVLDGKEDGLAFERALRAARQARHDGRGLMIAGDDFDDYSAVSETGKTC